MNFIWPYALPALLLIPLLGWGYLRLDRARRSTAAGAGPLAALQNRGRPAGRRRHLPYILFLLGAALLLLGMARPEMVVRQPRAEGSVILAFDVSASMTADDLEPSRLEAAKEAARILVENQPATIQIGVVVFGNGGLILEPPTRDQLAVLTAIDRISPEGGTSLGKGIVTALNALAGETLAIDESTPAEDAPTMDIGDFSSAVILLFSDGENTSAQDPLAVAQIAAEAGVRIYPVGLGTPTGAFLDLDGFKIISQLNESLLEQIADQTNGQYYAAADAAAVRDIYREIDLQLTLKEEIMEITAFLSAVSLGLMLAGGFLSMRWFGRLP